MSLRILKRDPSQRTLKEPYHWGPSEALGTLLTFTPQKTLFGFLLIVYDRMGKNDKF